MRVAVLGGGPAGAFAAERLASAGVSTIVIDEKLAWEKPCGGGLTYKAYQRYPFLIDNGTPKRLVSGTTLAAPGARQVLLALDQPLVIYSRKDLNGMLLQRAQAAGAQIEKTRVTGITRSENAWTITTPHGTMSADHCIIATGARNPLREYGVRLSAPDTMFALGYYVEGEQAGIDIQFLPGLAGYIWVFPRCGHMSVGICGKGEPAASLRKRLEIYMAGRGFLFQNAAFYSHVLPCLDTPAWDRARVSGPGWSAVGDAAGLVDPITGEGLYYAIRSADLAAQSLLDHTDYASMLQQDFLSDLKTASGLADRIFHGTFLLGSIPTRMVQWTARSPLFRGTIQDLFAGTQPYLTLKRRLLLNLPATMVELARHAAGLN